MPKKLGGLFAPILLLLFSFQTLIAEDYFLKNDNLVQAKAIQKINEIATEVYQKTGISVYFVLSETSNGQKIQDYMKIFHSSLKNPYILYCLTKNEKKVEIQMSSQMDKIVDKDRVLNKFVIPILASNNKTDLSHSYEAATLNGMVEIADQVASYKNVTINSNLGSDGYNLVAFLRLIFWTLVIVTLAILIRNKFFLKKKSDNA